jgi:hypothetical protein
VYCLKNDYDRAIADFTAAKRIAEFIKEAADQGNCAFLYAYTKQPKPDSKLAGQANAVLKRYASGDSSVVKYKTGRMDPRVRKVPEDLMEQVFLEPDAALPGVVSSLIKGVSDQFMKTKILHDWICDNIAYDAEMYFSDRQITDQDYVSVLKKKKAVCSGYTNLMNQMCELAGIESIGITGYSKGFGYTRKIKKDSYDHAWNGVKIGGRWYLVDVTWDAGPMEYRTFIKRYSTDWLFLDPRPFLYSHLPQEEQYQFYAPALTAEDFVREAYIPAVFFRYGLELKTGIPEYRNLVNNEFAFEITLRNSSVILSSGVYAKQGGRTANAASWQEEKKGAAAFSFSVPDAAEYTGYISARQRNVEQVQEEIYIEDFEETYLPGAEKLFAEKKITEQELEYFKASYFKVPDNYRYYFLEDQFDAPRNNGALKIHKLLGMDTGGGGHVLDFTIQAAEGYQGFGAALFKYPHTLSAYDSAPNTRILTPLTGTLKAGSAQTFILSSKDYNSFAIIIDGQWNYFTKNPKTGNFELPFTIPSGIETITISCGQDGNPTYWGLIQYKAAP